MTLGHLLTHVAGTYHGWLAGVIKDGAKFKRRTMPCKSVARARVLFNQAHARLEPAVAGVRMEDWNKYFSGAFRGEHYDYTLNWVIWHLVEHDIRHRAQMKMYLTYLDKKIKGKDFWG